MANWCDNEFFCETENPKTIEIIKSFLETELDAECYPDMNGTPSMTANFNSKWVFPKDEFVRLVELVKDDDTLSFNVKSTEFGCDYMAIVRYENSIMRMFTLCETDM